MGPARLRDRTLLTFSDVAYYHCVLSVGTQHYFFLPLLLFPPSVRRIRLGLLLAVLLGCGVFSEKHLQAIGYFTSCILVQLLVFWKASVFDAPQGLLQVISNKKVHCARLVICVVGGLIVAGVFLEILDLLGLHKQTPFWSRVYTLVGLSIVAITARAIGDRWLTVPRRMTLLVNLWGILLAVVTICLCDASDDDGTEEEGARRKGKAAARAAANVAHPCALRLCTYVSTVISGLVVLGLQRGKAKDEPILPLTVNADSPVEQTGADGWTKIEIRI